jgi:hypothetical protein
MSDKDGGPAFPTVVAMAPVLYNGMSLRDWFAGQALVGMLASPLIASNRESYAQWAYLQADAMLAERTK